MKCMLFVYCVFLVSVQQLYGQSTLVRYPGHETAFSFSYLENDTLYLGLANSKNFGNNYLTPSFFRQVKIFKQNNSIITGAYYSAIDSILPSMILGEFIKWDSLYFSIGFSRIPPNKTQLVTYVGGSKTVDTLIFTKYLLNSGGISGILPHPSNDSIALVYGGLVNDTLPYVPFILEYNLINNNTSLHIYWNDTGWLGTINDILYDSKKQKYILATTMPLPPNQNLATNPAYAYLDTNFVLDTTNLISSVVYLSHPSYHHRIGGKVYEYFSAMEWINDSTIIMVGDVDNPYAVPQPSTVHSDNYEDDIVVSIRRSSDFSEIGTSKIYGKRDTGETYIGGGRYPFVKMDSNLFVSATSMELSTYMVIRPWDTELALLGLDTNGNKHWMKYIPFNDYCWVEHLHPDGKGGLWVVAQCTEEHWTWEDWFVKVMYIDSVAYWPRIGQSTGLAESPASWDNKFRIFPNPADGKFTIRQYGNPMVLEMLIYDVNGRQIGTFEISTARSSYDVSEFNAGMYFVKIRSKGRILTTKKLLLR